MNDKEYCENCEWRYQHYVNIPKILTKGCTKQLFAYDPKNWCTKYERINNER